MSWLFPALPLARVAILRRVVYAFVIIDVLLLHRGGAYHAFADPAWYRPLILGELLHLPAATVPLVLALIVGSVGGAIVGVLARGPDGLQRAAAWVTAGCWIWFQHVAFAYGKVDHDRADFALALLLLPLVATVRTDDHRRSEAAGFVLRAIQLVAIATYFLSAWAKLRFGGLEWVNSATLLRAVIRRENPVNELLLHVPWTLHWFQWVLLGLELLSPLIFVVPELWRRRMVYGWYLFHAMVFVTIGIAFWPHLVMMLAFLPLEEYRDRLVARRSRGALGSRPAPSTRSPR